MHQKAALNLQGHPNCKYIKSKYRKPPENWTCVKVQWKFGHSEKLYFWCGNICSVYLIAINY